MTDPASITAIIEMRDQFTEHFHQQRGIDPDCTNHGLIDHLCTHFAQNRPGVTRIQCPGGSGTTRTLIEWAKWIQSDGWKLKLRRVLAISATPQVWKEEGIQLVNTVSHQSFLRGLLFGFVIGGLFARLLLLIFWHA